MELISFLSASAHAAGEVVTWIPSWDGSSGDAIWKDVSADQVSACLRFSMFSLLAHFSTDGLLGWIRLCYTAAQLRLQRHDQAAICERFDCYGHFYHRFMHNNAMRFVNLKTRCRRRDGAWPCRSKPPDKLERNAKFLRLCQWQ